MIVMEWLLSFLNQIFLFVVAVISSLVAAVLYRKYPQQVENLLSLLIRPRVFCRVIGANVNRLGSRLGLIAGLFVSKIILCVRAVLTSAESARLLGLTVVILALGPSLLLFLGLFNTHTVPDSLPPREIGTWTYSIVEEGEDLRARTLNLARNGMGVYSTSASLPSLITFQADGSVSVNELFGQEAALQGKLITTDITGDNVPDVLLVSSCGCSAGFNDYHLLSLDTEVKEIFTVEGQIGLWEFDDRDGDRIPEFIAREWLGDSESRSTTSVAVVLKYDSGNLKLASELMRKRAPSKHDFLSKVAKDKRKSKSNESTGPDNSYIAELVFGGNGELAHRYLNLVLADEPENEREFYWALIFENMASSNYWEEIAALNHWSPDQYAFNVCPY